MEKEPQGVPSKSVDAELTTPAKKNGKELLVVKDPLENVISLDVDTWEQHITLEHPEMADKLEDVKIALEKPMLIQRTNSSSTCFYYRLLGRAFYRHKDVYVTVVVHLPENEKAGRVKTAHLVKELRRNAGETLWLKFS